MRSKTILMVTFMSGLFGASAALAACEGSNGRGWGSGKGDGAFEMAAGDKACTIRFPIFIDDAAGTRTEATQVTLTQAPKSGKVGVGKTGLVYTPNPGFKGKDRFCTKNTAPKVKGTLAGCVTVTVR